MDMHTTHTQDRSIAEISEQAHPDNPALQTDHSALLSLMEARKAGAGTPNGESDVVYAKQSGAWDNPDTWGGTLPTDNQTVVIPAGIAVDYGAVLDTRLQSVLVWGELNFATDVDSQLIVDEILTAPGSVFTIGTEEDPVDADVSVDIIIREDTLATTDHARVNVDPTQLGKGIVTHGQVRINGTEKLEYARVSADPMAGDTELTFDREPEGWAVGDKIVVAGTHIQDQSEDRISGTSVDKIYHWDTDPNTGRITDIKQEFLDDFRRDAEDNGVEWDEAAFLADPEGNPPPAPGKWRFERGGTEFETQDEIRTITGVTENADGTWTVSFAEPLEFDHDAPKDVGADAGHEPQDLFTVVGNYSRNVSITSEVAHAESHPDGLDEIYVDDNAGFGAGEIHQRGHVMFMHNTDVEVRNAEFAGLGRADKSIPLDERDYVWELEVTPSLNDDDAALGFENGRWKIRLLDEDGEYTSGGAGDFASRDPYEIENHGGRYALHFHRVKGESAFEDATVVEGNAVFGSPGWGIVHHNSHLDVIDNTVFGVRGGGIVSETGNETGKWDGNLVVKTSGTGDGLFDPGGTAGRETAINDTFHGGDAFGFESRFIESTGNIAVSAEAFGYKFIKGVNDNEDGAPADSFLAAQGYDPYWGDDNIDVERAPNRTFVDNEAFASEFGLGSTLFKKFPNTTAQSTLDGFVSWNNDSGITFNYARGYLIKDSLFVGDDTRPEANGTQPGSGEGIGQIAINPGTDVGLVRVVNSHFEDVHREYAGNVAVEADLFVGNTSTNVDDPFISDQIRELMVDGIYQQNNRESTGFTKLGAIFADELSSLYHPDPDYLDFIPNGEWDTSISSSNDRVLFQGQMRDAAFNPDLDVSRVSEGQDPYNIQISNKSVYGNLQVGSDWDNVLRRDGYYTDDDGNRYITVDLVVASRVTGTTGVIKTLIDLTPDYPIPGDAIHMGDIPFGLSPESIDSRTSDIIIVDQREFGKTGNQLTEEEVLARVTVEPSEGAGQMAWELLENYKVLGSGSESFDRNGTDNVDEMAIYRTEGGPSRLEIGGGVRDADVDGQGTTWSSLFGRDVRDHKVQGIFSAVAEYSGEGDVMLVDGGQPGDDFFTLALQTGGDLDFIRFEGNRVADAISTYFAQNPDVVAVELGAPFAALATDPHAHHGGDGHDGHAGHGHGDDMDGDTTDGMGDGHSHGDPEPVEPDPVDPAPVDPDPVEPDPVDQDPIEPDPVEPDPVDPDPVDPPQDDDGNPDGDGAGSDEPPADNDVIVVNGDEIPEVAEMVEAALNKRYGIEERTDVTFLGLSDEGISVRIPSSSGGTMDVMITGAAVATAVTGYMANLNELNDSININRGEAVAHLNTDTDFKLNFGNGTQNIEIDDQGTSLKDLVGDAVFARGRKENLDDFIEAVLEAGAEGAGDIRLVAGGEAGDNFLSVAITNNWNSSHEDLIIVEGAAAEEAIAAYHEENAAVSRFLQSVDGDLSQTTGEISVERALLSELGVEDDPSEPVEGGSVMHMAIIDGPPLDAYPHLHHDMAREPDPTREEDEIDATMAFHDTSLLL